MSFLHNIYETFFKKEDYDLIHFKKEEGNIPKEAREYSKQIKQNENKYLNESNCYSIQLNNFKKPSYNEPEYQENSIINFKKKLEQDTISRS
jgi:hypothetical protein